MKKMEFLFDSCDQLEWTIIKWGLKEINVSLDENAFFARVKIRHHLRGGNPTSFNNETWLFVLVKNAVDIFYMCPLKRDSDFEFDVFDVVRGNCGSTISAPWQRRSL